MQKTNTKLISYIEKEADLKEYLDGLMCCSYMPETPHFFIKKADYRGRSFFVLNESDSLLVFCFDEVGKIKAYCAVIDDHKDVSTIFKEVYSHKKMNEIKNNILDNIKSIKTENILQTLNSNIFGVPLSFIEMGRYASLSEEISLMPGDDETKDAIKNLDNRINEEIHNLFMMQNANFLIEDYNMIVEKNNKNRAIIDIITRHPWITSEKSFKKFYNFMCESNWNRHPDDIVFDFVTKYWLPEGQFKGFNITKNGVRAMVGLHPREAKRNVLRLLIYFSMIPPSWAFAFKDHSKLAINYHLSSFIDTDLVNNSNDMISLIKDMKGDYKKIEDTIQEQVKIAKKEKIDYAHDIIFAHRDHDYRHNVEYDLNGFLNRGSKNDYLGKGVFSADYLSVCEKYFTEIKDYVKHIESNIVLPILNYIDPKNIENSEIKNRWLKQILGNTSLFKLKKKDIEWHQDENWKKPINQACWFPLTPDYKASNGVEIKVLTSSIDLFDEGVRGEDRNGILGLSHCISSYSKKCLDGVIHVLSVRKNVNGKYIRLSTLSVEVNNRKAKIEQHRGFSNKDPSNEAKKAVTEYMKIIGKGLYALSLKTGKNNEIYFDNSNSETIQSHMIVLQNYINPEYKGISFENLVSLIKEDTLEPPKKVVKKRFWQKIFSITKLK